MSGALLALPFGLGVGLLLGLVGGGGSTLAVFVLVYVLGQPVKAATTESLLIVGAPPPWSAQPPMPAAAASRSGPGSPSARRARPERSPAPRSTGSSGIGRCALARSGTGWRWLHAGTRVRSTKTLTGSRRCHDPDTEHAPRVCPSAPSSRRSRSGQQTMEPLWSPAVATSGNCWQCVGAASRENKVFERRAGMKPSMEPSGRKRRPRLHSLGNRAADRQHPPPSP